MTKSELLDELQEFNAHHHNRLKSIENAIKGIADDASAQSCVKIADCLLYKWTVQRDAILRKVFSYGLINELRINHEEWHEESQKICNISIEHKKKNSGVLSLMFGKKNIKMDGGERDIALVYLSNLKAITVQIDKVFEKMIKRVNAMPKDMFKIEE